MQAIFVPLPLSHHCEKYNKEAASSEVQSLTFTAYLPKLHRVKALPTCVT